MQRRSRSGYDIVETSGNSDENNRSETHRTLALAENAEEDEDSWLESSEYSTDLEESMDYTGSVRAESDRESFIMNDESDAAINAPNLINTDSFPSERQLNVLSPDLRIRVENAQEKYAISMLPDYFPGITGCRNINEFIFLNQIGEGAFGVVYRAIEKKTDEIVALKWLKFEKATDEFSIRSLREIRLLMKTSSHPNIVNIREVVFDSNMDKVYLVMEYIEHNMRTLIKQRYASWMRFSTGQVKTLMCQLLEGVAHLHDEWILHRDLKTANLLFSNQGILKICDFGLARQYGSPLKAYSPDVATLNYRAPELLLGASKYSTAVDMWSCGCIFAEVLTLERFFNGETVLDQIQEIFLKLGTPDEETWPGYFNLPFADMLNFSHEFNCLCRNFSPNSLDKIGMDLMNKLLCYDPNKRLSAYEALKSKWFQIDPLPVPPSMFPQLPGFMYSVNFSS